MLAPHGDVMAIQQAVATVATQEGSAGGETEVVVVSHEQLYRDHAGAILRYLEFSTGDPELARDLLQDTFATALGALAGFRGEGSHRTWLRRIAINRARRVHRRRGLRKQAEDLAVGQRAIAEATDTQVRRQQAIEQLYKAMDELTLDERETFVARILEDIPLAQVSEILGVPVSTVSERARRAQSKVKAHFAALENSP